LNNSSDEELYIFELEDDLYTYIDTFDYDGYSFWINEDGDILSQNENNNARMNLFDRSSSETISITVSNSTFLPFLYAGEFYATRSTNNNIYTLEVLNNDFEWNSDSGFTSNYDDYAPSASSVKRGNYELSASCELYYFDNSNTDEINVTMRNFPAIKNGKLAVAGQNSLFCVHADSSSNSANPIITKFDIDTDTYSSFETTEGSISDAVERFTVISDGLVMFSESQSGSFNEYYINFDESSEETIKVTENSIVTLQTLEN